MEPWKWQPKTEMDSWQNLFEDVGNFDVDVDRRLSPNQMTLSPSFAIGSERFYVEAVEEIEADNSQAGNLNADDGMGYLQILSSEEDDPNDTSVGDEMEIIVSAVGMKFKDENDVFEFYKNYTYQIRFPVLKRDSKKGDDGVVRYVTFTCSREGTQDVGTQESICNFDLTSNIC